LCCLLALPTIKVAEWSFLHVITYLNGAFQK
jgi:hypothetical protein